MSSSDKERFARLSAPNQMQGNPFFDERFVLIIGCFFFFYAGHCALPGRHANVGPRLSIC
jgi:hypothetical protein